MSSSNRFQTAQHVEWEWGDGVACGQVAKRFEREVPRTLKGSQVTRKGDADDPAYLIRQADGDEVLKLGSELKEV